VKRWLLILSCSAAACTGISSDPEIRAMASGCSLPADSFSNNSNPTATVALMIGTWVRCSGGPLLGHADERGIQFGDDGYFETLVDNHDTLVVNSVFGYQGVWTVKSSGEVDWQAGPGQGDGDTPTIMLNPRRFKMWLHYNSEPSVYALVDTNSSM
jgi:hypothetical protein